MTDHLPLRLKALRARKGWSLKQLAERSGVSVGMLSEIERGSKNPTVRLAYDVAQALGCSISTLVEGQPELSPAPDDHAAVRPQPSAVLNSTESGVRREGYANSLLHGGLEVVVYTLQPGATSGEMAPNRPGTMELLVVLDGELELVIDGRQQRLQPGCSAAHGVHQTEYRNPSSTSPCRYLVLVETTRSGA